MGGNTLGRLRQYLEGPEGKKQPPRVRLILDEIEKALADPRDPRDPLAELAARQRASELLLALYGDGAIDQARQMERRTMRTFARLVTRRLERFVREGENEQAPSDDDA